MLQSLTVALLSEPGRTAAVKWKQINGSAILIFIFLAFPASTGQNVTKKSSISHFQENNSLIVKDFNQNLRLARFPLHDRAPSSGPLSAQYLHAQIMMNHVVPLPACGSSFSESCCPPCCLMPASPPIPP